MKRRYEKTHSSIVHLAKLVEKFICYIRQTIDIVVTISIREQDISNTKKYAPLSLLT